MRHLKKGMLVADRWWPWEVGRVVWKGKTRLHVQFGDRLQVYDAAHCRFLTEATR